jgi:hypothetical protein
MAGERQDPFARSESEEPIDDLEVVRQRMRQAGVGADKEMVKATVQQVLGEMETIPRSRETKIRPAEKRRRARQLSVTFSTPDIPQRIKALARQWEMFGPDGKRPNFSAVVEYLLLSQLEAAEAGEIAPPED